MSPNHAFLQINFDSPIYTLIIQASLLAILLYLALSLTLPLNIKQNKQDVAVCQLETYLVVKTLIFGVI